MDVFPLNVSTLLKKLHQRTKLFILLKLCGCLAKISFYFCNAEKAVAATLTMLGCRVTSFGF